MTITEERGIKTEEEVRASNSDHANLRHECSQCPGSRELIGSLEPQDNPFSARLHDHNFNLGQALKSEEMLTQME